MEPSPASYSEITDENGRVYRVGETSHQLLGRSRVWMMWLPWVAMFAVSSFEYGWGAVEETLEERYGWTLTDAFWLASIWAVFQAGVAFPAGRLREKGVVSARAAMITGAICCGVSWFTLAHVGNLAVGFVGYSVLGGTGAGLVYATCINMVGKWYPEKRGARVGFVNGAFAYGVVPIIYVFSYVMTPGNYSFILDVLGVYMLIVVLVCGYFFRDPPKNWWPESIDPLRWAARGRATAVRSLVKNPPAVRQFSPMEAIRSGMLPLMWGTMVVIGMVSLFGINFEVPFAKQSGFGPFVVASAAGVLSIVNGTGRALVGWVSDQIGRRQTLTIVLLIAAVAQFGVLYAGNTRNLWLFMVAAFLTGFGSGAFYPLFATLVPDYFGENHNATNYGIVYSSKLVGGIGGGGVAAGVIVAWGYTGAYLLAGGAALLAALLSLFLRQPGRGRTHSTEAAAEVGGTAIAGN
ncbi:MFS family permease [Amycolatopsis bartoniae]|uniref:MFS transporter n=1 Tax=Amycolatopsis bartoniae TaxID=941986 RepID=A0A8H9IYC1_9PSEU|nr:OFA family MFS transporter [Amycolatopsis bartoniae]MBB2935601.1 MFS family permease [Amycolatopsis bartoniae]TVT05218.1 OFA family MFS transporter [Amycolatopsis bartoniae]GHF76910.1 MFS transporter [Amycolatopsis bartoniae]